ncbi:hypothetical protein OGM63_25160 [Plectonema radiosum NIES-515]|uniref:Uncharacterized protein n=1 Tax=Plectonema radiosum NIES-515 TaxID=2986073 RepID=A0ABT3B5V6_9CYAN|nr:hypothetical protein [Plectonema radiosum]MCV3216753.1 hypothetical protein [Plectonema radiosum NIES-515]
MKKQIVIAIALPIVLASATSSFAGEVVKKPVITPSTVKPVVSVPITGTGEDTHRNGEGNIGKKPVKPPTPPRREPILVNQRQILQPVNSTLPSQNTNRPFAY